MTWLPGPEGRNITYVLTNISEQVLLQKLVYLCWYSQQVWNCYLLSSLLIKHPNASYECMWCDFDYTELDLFELINVKSWPLL